jgi:hypothetical protein
MHGKAIPNRSNSTSRSCTGAYSSSSSSSASAVVWAIPVLKSAFRELTPQASKLTVQISLASLSDAASALVLVVLENANLLQRLHDLAVDASRGIDVLGWPDAAVLGRAVELSHAADADCLAEVDVARDRGGADVEPVDVLRRELLGGSRLDGVNPTLRELLASGGLGSVGQGLHTWDGQLALSLQEGGIRLNELLRLPERKTH